MFIFGWQNIQYRFLMFLGCPLTLYMSATEVAKLGLSRKARCWYPTVVCLAYTTAVTLGRRLEHGRFHLGKFMEHGDFISGKRLHSHGTSPFF